MRRRKHRPLYENSKFKNKKHPLAQVGYGDITASNTAETVYATVVSTFTNNNNNNNNNKKIL